MTGIRILIFLIWGYIDEVGYEFHIQSIYDFDFAKADKVADFVNERCSHVFLILQDRIRIAESYGNRIPYDGIKNLLEKIQKPVVVAGLGANSFMGFDSEFYKQLSPELVDFLHYLSGRCVELGVRGNYTAEVLGQLGVKNAVPIGCPSYFETGKDRVIKKKAALDVRQDFLHIELSVTPEHASISGLPGPSGGGNNQGNRFQGFKRFLQEQSVVGKIPRKEIYVLF